MNLRRIAFAAAVCLLPVAGNATTYRLAADVNGTPEDLGTVSIAETIVANGGLGLTKTCAQFLPCIQGGPWDQVSFDLASNLQKAVVGNGAGTQMNFALSFGPTGDVTAGSIQLEASTGAAEGPFLTASLNSFFAIDPRSCRTGTELCGTYLSDDLGNPVPITIAFHQEREGVGRPPHSVPEPGIGWPLLLASFLGIAGGAKVLRRKDVS